VKEGELNPVDEGGADSVNEEGELELVGEGKPVILEPESRGVVATSTVLEKRNVDPSNDTSVPEVVAASPIPNGADSAQYVDSADESTWATRFSRGQCSLCNMDTVY
jgi:hypothetical protein